MTISDIIRSAGRPLTAGQIGTRYGRLLAHIGAGTPSQIMDFLAADPEIIATRDAGGREAFAVKKSAKVADLHEKIATFFVESGVHPAVTTVAEAEAYLTKGLLDWLSSGNWQGNRIDGPRWRNRLLDAWEAASYAGDYNDNGYAATCVAEYLAEFRELTKPQEEVRA